MECSCLKASSGNCWVLVQSKVPEADEAAPPAVAPLVIQTDGFPNAISMSQTTNPYIFPACFELKTG